MGDCRVLLWIQRGFVPCKLELWTPKERIVAATSTRSFLVVQVRGLLVQCVRLAYGFSVWSEESIPVADQCCDVQEGFERFELVAPVFSDFSFSSEVLEVLCSSTLML